MELLRFAIEAVLMPLTIHMKFMGSKCVEDGCSTSKATNDAILRVKDVRGGSS